MNPTFNRLATLVRGHIPTRESLEANRWLRPFAHRVLRPDLWRFNRRSVPRGIALGLFTGILIPFAHTPIAALAATGVRANMPVAIGTTWTSNPFTWIVMFPAAFRISSSLGLHVDFDTFRAMLSHGASLLEWLHWLSSRAAPAVMLGLFVLATIVSSIGYLAASFFWRWKIARKRRLRLTRGLARAHAGVAPPTP